MILIFRMVIQLVAGKWIDNYYTLMALIKTPLDEMMRKNKAKISQHDVKRG